jgi:2-haloalkanoic acid dehalogenase type II
MKHRYDAVAFDLLTGLLDSWTLWNRVAGGPDAGHCWRAEYLRLTYGAGRYRPYQQLVAESAEAAGLPCTATSELVRRWSELAPWPEVRSVLTMLAGRSQLAIVTNCSEPLAAAAVDRTGMEFAVVVSAERAGWYKPQPQPYALALQELGLTADRVLFVAGSPADIAGAAGVGMPVFWHNRIGLPMPPLTDATRHHLLGTADSLHPLIPLVLSQ